MMIIPLIIKIIIDLCNANNDCLNRRSFTTKLAAFSQVRTS